MFLPTQGLFNPSRYGKTTVLDIPNAVLSAIMKTAVDSRNDLWKNIVLSGKLGSTWLASLVLQQVCLPLISSLLPKPSFLAL